MLHKVGTMLLGASLTLGFLVLAALVLLAYSVPMP